MDVLFDRVAGLDIGKASVTVCVRTPGPQGKRVSQTRTFKTMTRSLEVPPARLKASGQKTIGEDANSAWMLPAVRPNHVWSYDFVAARTDDGGSLRILNVIDENTRVALGSHVARSIGAVEVTRHLERLFA